MKIKVLDILGSESELRFSIPVLQLIPFFSERGDFRCVSDAKVALKIYRIDNIIRFSGRILIPALITCARCGEKYESQVTAPVQMVLEKAGDGTREEDEVGYGLYNGNFIDLTHYCLESFSLNLPLSLFCDPDCNGLCYVCGANLNEGECGCKH